MTLALSINLKSITPIVGACGPTNIPRTIKNGMTENLNFPAITAAIATNTNAVPTSKLTYPSSQSPIRK